MLRKQDKMTLHVKKEFERMQLQLAPIIRKSTIYSFISIPLLSFALFNLFLFLFNGELPIQDFTIAIAIFCLMGAFGLALFKESMHKNKEFIDSSITYIKDRIATSSYVPDQAKERYLHDIKEDPRQVFWVFQQFLEQEERIKRLDEVDD
ncbi:YwnF family protein [Halalkalibacterium halodurans]|uniref:Uncharacterized protein n=1 Tax=Halalkalibacterium halodurans TaxID=86665 RepID=A0A0M0KKP2_ALKHA|nr:YwnF family protein [Halalkalibacterium halodurans]MED3646850.1 YwnF family protein [Halalkalibacterium halodurans]MED4125048.1 YwnF family protein [Halalkalibacterium halodurans]TPE70986.1 hypothetical protein AMD02_000935 [Halalkalibacterium halodurans]